MNNREKYYNLFCHILEINPQIDLQSVKRFEFAKWDSLNNFILISNIEENFSCVLTREDMIKFETFESGINILREKGIEI